MIIQGRSQNENQQVLLLFVRVPLKNMVFVTFASNFTTATAATTQKIAL